jgi:hypothetical protein
VGAGVGDDDAVEADVLEAIVLVTRKLTEK